MQYGKTLLFLENPKQNKPPRIKIPLCGRSHAKSANLKKAG